MLVSLFKGIPQVFFLYQDFGCSIKQIINIK